MRYYDLAVFAPNVAPAGGGPVQPLLSGAKLFEYTTYVNGANIMGALNIEFDVSTSTFDLPVGNSFLRIWGIGLPLIGYANNLNNGTLQLQAGMQKGLPLANPNQKGLLFSGRIQQAFANWQGTEQSLEFLLSPAPNANITFSWQKGQTINQALQNALTTAYPGVTINLAIAPNIVAPETHWGHYDDLYAFAIEITALTTNIVGGSYTGVRIAPAASGNVINIFDSLNTPNVAPINIAFTDLIGQPTWLDINLISVKTVMRADITMSSVVTLPQTPITSTQQSNTGYRSALTFSGQYLVQAVRHIGNYKQQDANSWVTVLQCAALGISSK